MICQWEGFLRLVPHWIRCSMDPSQCCDLEELRLRVNSPPELRFHKMSQFLDRGVSTDDLLFCINAASQYSPWAAATVRQGYITSPEGHRIGLCGEAVFKHGQLDSIRDPDSLCIRVNKDYPQLGHDIPLRNESILILGAPGWGKTTLLRSIARRLSEDYTVCVVDERGEILPKGFSRGKRMDVLRSCTKKDGIPMVLRTMSPQFIAVDEITDQSDILAICNAANCGVHFLATAHAASIEDLKQRPIYRHLLQQGVFQKWILLHSDKSYTVEDAVCSV